MSLGQLGMERTFQHWVQGLTGDFTTPAGKVSYLMTKARLGADATNPERRLTQHLVPVREVIPAEQLDFNQLLQRDLDDHRVAVNLVPYLLDSDPTGPAFFPPIVAVALPFHAQQPGAFPNFGEPEQVKDRGLLWSQSDAGESVRIRRLLTDGGTPNPAGLGQLCWNEEYCRLVVIDGQHRAMALLAIDRTVRNTWQSSTGGRYRYFYESRIREALEGREISEIEVPVTVLWFPELFGQGTAPHKAARKLFVDVNKEARTPSESRLILLSDSELVNILTRTSLTQLRNQSEQEFLPLYCVEYDNPDTKTTQSARWSALTNIHAIKQMVNRAIFGPPKYISDVESQFSGREPEEMRDAFMRQQLEVSNLFPAEISGDEPFARDQLGNARFPDSAIPVLANKFRDSWSKALLGLLSDIAPWKAHATALSRLKHEWLADDAIASLAHDALFGGVGMYWTLRDSAQHWDENRGGRTSKPDVVKAWDMIAGKQTEFELLRAEEFLQSRTQREQVNLVFQAMNTHACQLGIALALTTVYQHARKDASVEVTTLAGGIASAVNAWMKSKTDGSYDRRLVFAKKADSGPKYPFNLISNMDTPRAMQFRYLWLEIFSSPEAASCLKDLINPLQLQRYRDLSRNAYIRYIAGEKARALKTSNPELDDTDRREQATADAKNEIRRALNRWFGIQELNEDIRLEPDVLAGEGQEGELQIEEDPAGEEAEVSSSDEQ